MTGDVNQAHLKKLDPLPEGWGESYVGQIVKMVSTNGKKLPQKKYMEKAEYPVIDQGQNFIGGYHNDESLLVEGEPPYVIFGDHSRAFKFANFNFIPGADGVKVMQPLGVDSKWAFYVFQAIKLPNKGYARHFQYLKEAYLPVPPPEQQKRIVAKIEELFSHIDAGIEALNKAKQLLKQYRQSVLKAAVTGELTKDWREQNKDKLEPASELLKRILKERRQKWEEQQLDQFKAKGKIPKNDKWKEKYKGPQEPFWHGMDELVEGWSWVTVEQLASDVPRAIQSGPFGSNLKHSEFQKEGKLVVGIDNVREGFFSMGSENRISEEKFKELDKYIARPGDVLITVMATIGRTCVIPEDLEPAIITKHVYRITIDKKLADPDFVNMYLWGAPDAREQFFGQTIGQTRPGLNGGIIRRVCLPLPSLDEQRAILSAVKHKDKSISRLKETIDAQITNAEKNKQSILAWAFSGKLVPNNSQGESAKSLLMRIKKDKAERNRVFSSSPPSIELPLEANNEDRIMVTKDLRSILVRSAGELTVDELFERSDFSYEEIEEFYSQLKKLVSKNDIRVESPYDLVEKEYKGTAVKVRAV